MEFEKEEEEEEKNRRIYSACSYIEYEHQAKSIDDL
jgi:hypothetical protein